MADKFGRSRSDTRQYSDGVTTCARGHRYCACLATGACLQVMEGALAAESPPPPQS